MKLRSGNSLWTVLSKPPLFPPLDHDESCHVAIIGAGVTGALIALELSRRGVSTVVVDSRDACMGSTAACTALVQYEIDRMLVDLNRQLGWRHAAGAYKACRRALGDFVALVDEVGGRCDLMARPSLFLAKHARDLQKLKAEAAARQKLGLEVRLMGPEELGQRFGIKRPGALLSKAAYAVDPLKLTRSLLRAAARHGARIYAKTPVELGPRESSRHVLHTNTGYKICCRHLVIATGYETPEQFKAIHKLCQLRSTYALATRPLARRQPSPVRTLIWEMGDPYCYARMTGERRIIIGGEDEDIVDPKKRDRLLPKKVKRLARKLDELFPELHATPEFCWAGTFAQTKDGLPYIGATRRYPGCYFALGYGGNGITFSVLASQIIADKIQGIRNPDARLFRFDR